jgi:hypothetical protein
MADQQQQQPQQQQTGVKLQKALIMPPLSGLNMHDNPLSMPIEFATELVNYMPPTTELRVRPGVKNIIQIPGSVRGMFPYKVGARKTYKQHWYDIRIEQPALNLLIVKYLDYTGNMQFAQVDPTVPSMITTNSLPGTAYSDDFTVYSNSLFFVAGDGDTTPYIFNGKYGLNQMVWLGPATPTMYSGTQLPDLENMTCYQKWLFANGRNSLNVFYTDASAADPYDLQYWQRTEELFCPPATGVFELNAFVKKGGSILKIFTMSSSFWSQNDQFATYLCVCTTEGEVAVFTGSDPTTEATWQCQGVFDIPIPINNRCFSFVDGDYAIVTENGLVSISRIILGKVSNITEPLEWRLSDLFNGYEFRMNAFKQYFFLRYYQAKRWLIFNVPEQMPIDLKDIILGYEFNNTQSLLMSASDMSTDGSVGLWWTKLQSFIQGYLFPNALDYVLNIVFDNSGFDEEGFPNEGIKFAIVTTRQPPVSGQFVTTIFARVCSQTSQGYNLFLSPAVIADFGDVNDAVMGKVNWYPQNVVWNPQLKRNYNGTDYYTYTFQSTHVVTSITAEATQFSETPYTVLVPSDYINVGSSYLPMSTIKPISLYYSGVVTAFNSLYGQSLEDLIKDVLTTTDSSKAYPFPVFAAFFDSFGGSNIPIGSSTNWTTTQLDLTYSDPDNIFPYALTLLYRIEFNYDDELYCTCSIELSGGGSPILKGSNTMTVHPDTSWTSHIISVGTPTIQYPTPKNQVVLPNISSDKYSCTANAMSVKFSDFFADVPTANIWANVPHTGAIKNTDDKASYMYLWLLDTFIFTGAPTDIDVYTANVDLSLVPMLNLIKITCPYKSSQYVMDAHYGTWTQWKDIDMVTGVEYGSEFYFIRPNYEDIPSDVPIGAMPGWVSKFDYDQVGDFNTEDVYKPISTSYKSGHTNFNMPNNKLMKSVKVYGTRNAFWYDGNPEDMPAPYKFIFVTDFKDNAPVYYQHQSTMPTIQQLTGIAKTHLKELTYAERRMYMKAYYEEALKVDEIQLRLPSNPCTRISVGSEMQISQPNVVVYGYEIYYEIALP